jgi:hypothetical protein
MTRSKKRQNSDGIAAAMESGQAHTPPFVIFDETACENLKARYKLNCDSEDLAAALVSAGDAYINAGPFGYAPLRSPYREASENLGAILHAALDLETALLLASDRSLRGLFDQAAKSGLHMGETRGLGGWHTVTDDHGAKLHIRGLVYALHKVAKANYPDALAARKKPRRGRPVNSGVEVFVRRLARFWVKATGKPFTVDYSTTLGGKGAARFIVDALTLLDNVPETVVLTAARKVRKELAADKNSPPKR